MLHRKQYKEIAQIFASYNVKGEELTDLYYGDEKIGALMTDLIKYFKADNPNFNVIKFEKACRGK